MKEKLKSFFTISSFKQLFPYILIGLVVAMLEVFGELLDVLQGVNHGLPGYSLDIKEILTLGGEALGWWIFISLLLFLGWEALGRYTEDALQNSYFLVTD